MRSLKNNFIFDMLNNISNLIFPLITFPYVTRVLLPDGLGTANFCQSLIQYVVMISALGIPTYATKEVSKLRDQKEKLSIFTFEILILHTIFSVIGYFISLLLLFIPSVHVVEKTYLIASLHIIFNLFGLTWFYQGIEEFKFITIRALSFRIVSVFLLFFFVKDSGDVNVYMFITILSEVGNNICNVLRIHKYVDFDIVSFNKLDLARHMRPIVSFFLISVSTMIYFNTDNIMIGLIKDTQAVGYYTPALKIQRLSMTILLSIGTILFPRLANLNMVNKSAFWELGRKGLLLTIGLGLPVFFAVVVLSEDLIILFSGTSYGPSILALSLLSPVILFGTCSNIISKILICQNMNRIVLRSTAVGAIINILFNGLLISFFSHYGAALASTISEIGVLSTMLYYGKCGLSRELSYKHTIVYVSSAFIMLAILLCIQLLGIENIIFELFLSVVVGTISYLICLVLFKDTEIAPFVRKCVSSIKWHAF